MKNPTPPLINCNRCGAKPFPQYMFIIKSPLESSKLFRIQCPRCYTFTRWHKDYFLVRKWWNLRNEKPFVLPGSQETDKPGCSSVGDCQTDESQMTEETSPATSPNEGL